MFHPWGKLFDQNPWKILESGEINLFACKNANLGNKYG